ncbi:hypothetical protein ACJMK2_017817 [Sinanodonta woodiana]|uniref:5'-nucleotidase domain-containing protein 3 n=1 Tax=Sinanodonta woodiana TaxID=1069815 RepID=A0ABD3UE73_SINWO
MAANLIRINFGGIPLLVFNSPQCFPFRHICHFSTTSYIRGKDWAKVYHDKKEKLKAMPLPRNINPTTIFANNEVRLSNIQVYGFDYDYTLATYKPELYHLLYKLGREMLVTKYTYPDEILDCEFDPNFAVRGLIYDVRKGLLMKMDSYHNIQLGTVYRGCQPVNDEEVITLYEGTHVSLDDMSIFNNMGPMFQLVDLFAPPEICLMSNVTEFFIKNNIPYDPEYVFHDVRTAVQNVHDSGEFHQKIMENLETYMVKDDKIRKLLDRLVESGKKLFIITNSGFPFVEAGMRYMLGDNWAELFDVIVCRARKPKFFNQDTRPFRLYDPATKEETWDRVRNLMRGKVYMQGNFKSFQHMTGWYGSKVIYLGDHVYTDLRDPSLKQGWRTGAIVPELWNEIQVINTDECKNRVRWLVAIEQLLEEIQIEGSADGQALIQQLLEERNELRLYLKSAYNKQFGSLFRTFHNPTYYSRRLARYADIYMSNLTNFLQYSVDHTFYPRRTALPHEPYPFS